MLDLLNSSDAALLKKNVADRQRLIDDQNIGFHMDGDGKRQTHEHAAGVSLNRAINELADFRELFNIGNSLARLGIGEAENRSVDINVFSAGKLQIESGSQLE